MTTENTWFNKYWKWTTAIILALAAIGDAVSGFQFIIRIVNYLQFLLYIPIWLLVILFFICLIVYSIYANRETKLPKIINYGLIFVAVFSGILFMAKHYINDPEKKFVIVYDDERGKPDLDFGNIKPEFQKIDHLFELHTTGQLNNAIFISTISRPEIKWKNEFPNNTKISSPIFSIQQVIEPNKMSNIIDISLSDFATEIATEIKKHNAEIRIFYEEGFKIASDELKSKLLKSNSSTVINAIEFDEKGFRNLLSNDVNIIFLGCSNTFKNNIYNLDNQQYKALIVPNWIRPNIVAKNDKTNRICALSETYDKLVSNDFKTWKNIIDIIKDEDCEIPNFTDNIKTKIRSNFANNNQVFPVHF